MWRHFSQMYCFYILCVFVQVKYEISQEHGPAEVPETEPRPKCTKKYCTCDEIPSWVGVDCMQYFWAEFPTLFFRNYQYLPAHVKRLTYLPERMFAGMHITTIHLWEYDIDVAENVLEGILSLDEFNVGGSSIQVVPDFRFVKNSIKRINIFNSLITSLGGKNLQNLTQLLTLSFINNTIQYIDPDALKGTENISSFYLDYNLLTHIPPKLLDPMKNLSVFSVKHNRLLTVNHLFYVTRPKEIFLEFNNITIFSLSQIFNLEKAQPFREIDYLDLKHNSIEETSPPASTCTRNLDAILKIRRLNLNGNKMINLNGCLWCSQVKLLEIVGNRIESLTETDFESVYSAEELVLRENQIHRIDGDAFKPFSTSLMLLNLKANRIKSINGSLKYLSSLRRLFLSYNSIQTIAEDDFAGLLSLSELHLEHNHIKSLGATLLKLEKLEFLNITHNDIELMNSDQMPNTLQSLYLADIPLKCDCKSLPFLKSVKHDKENGICLRFELKNTLQNTLNCPGVCTCKCAEIGDSFSMFVDCSSRNLSSVPYFMEKNLPQLEVNKMFYPDDRRRYRVMYQNVDSSKHFEGSVLGVNLENNKLDILDATQLPPNLAHLYLSNNNLRRFPQSLIDSQTNLKQVSLSGNPWKCDCDALDFKKWLASNNHIIKDLENVRCGINDEEVSNLNESVLWKLNDIDLCPPTNFVLIFSVSSLSFFIFCLIAKVIYTAYELSIKVSLYSHGFTFVKEKVPDQDKAFDAFISFSDEDSELVITEIISEIEKRDPNIRLCLHYRHFRPGVPIVDNIKHAVQKSKMTLLIISRTFLESEWCMFEFQTALRENLQDNVHRVIAVKVGQLPREIDPTMKVYLESTTYLIWGESNFWNKLLYILPSRRSDIAPGLRCLKSQVAGRIFRKNHVLSTSLGELENARTFS